MSRFGLLLWFAVVGAPVSARAEPIPMQACEAPENFSDLVAWMNAVDTQTLINHNAPAGKDDYQSPLGFVIRKSCLEGASTDRVRTIDRIERAAALLLQQTSRCYKLTGLPQLESVLRS